eukprot:TRINITY_DN31159_c0_g1_i1.p1 TRINITY_DN31159_c0_g1~~TRINITY_DN31159_c0_g1_i1.p1  ORF type:complete len:592 (-),score=80.23 TRINITY_DN31159_c0_g1_i1:68-1843(-)
MGPEEMADLRHLVHAASRCFGPCGRSRAARFGDGRGARTFVTSNSAALLQCWPVRREHHVIRLVIDTIEAHLRRSFDGGWLFLNFCLRAYTALAGLGAADQVDLLPRAASLHGLALAAVWLEQALTSEDCPCRHKLQWSDLPAIMALLRAALCKSAALPRPEDVRHISVVLLEAFLEALPSAGDLGSDNDGGGPCCVWFCGPDIAWSHAERGVLLDTPSAISVPPPSTGEDLRLVLFEASLEQWLLSAAPTGTDGASTAVAGSAVVGVDRCIVETDVGCGGESADALRVWELSRFERLANALLKAGVKVLACQKLVDPWLSDYLRHRGVTVLARLSLRHVDHVRRLSGAFPVLSLATLPECWANVCGVIGGLEMRTICSRTYTLLHPPSTAGKTAAVAAAAARQSSSGAAVAPLPVATAFLGAPDENALAELKRCVPQALYALRVAARSGSALLGGGLTEVYLADTVTSRAQAMALSSSPSDVAASRAALHVARSLQDVAACLVSRPASEVVGSGYGLGPPAIVREEFLQATRASLAQLSRSEVGAPSMRPSGVVLDADEPKRSALLGALDLAGVLLRLGGTLDLTNQPIG